MTFDKLTIILVGLCFLCAIAFRCGYDFGFEKSKNTLVQELCLKGYDFCQEVPQKPVFILKSEKK